MPTTYRGKFGRVDVADSAAHYFHVDRRTGTPMLMPNVDGGYPLVYVDERSADYFCAACATGETVNGNSYRRLGPQEWGACVWTQRSTRARSGVFRRWSRVLTMSTPRRLVRFGRSVLTLALTPAVLWEGPAEHCSNCDRRIRSAYGPLANVRRDKRIGASVPFGERPRRWTRLIRADVGAFYPRARRSVSRG